jgi:hypothetical protein
MADESTFFQSRGIAVTNARFIVGAQTFAMHGITSVQGVETPASYGWPALLTLVGLIIMALSLFGGEIGVGVFGVLLFAAGIWLFTRQKPKFAVVLRTAGGEVTAYESRNRDHIAEIIRALNEAIISHG